uniref:flagellar motor protein MotB n=1 Tax=Castellaniella defragrans TaxID=75697 RepID=UPI00333EE3CB
MAKHDAGRIVVRRKRMYGESGHGGSWKIAYADFMTAMMAFFLVMWLLMLVPAQDLKVIAEYFRMPLMTAISGGPNLDTSKSVIPGGEPSIIPNTFSLPVPDDGDGSGAEDREDAVRLESLQHELENLIEHNPILQQYRPHLLLDMTPDGLRVQILDQRNRPMFAVGSAVMQSDMRDILRELAPALNSLPNSMTVSGHTDAMRYAAGDRQYSNWELSADRANAARRELVAGGLVENKIKRILGLADTVNLIKDKPHADINRRISILVLNRRTEQQIDEQNAAGQDSARFVEQLGGMFLPVAPEAGPASSAGRSSPPAGPASSQGAPGPAPSVGTAPSAARPASSAPENQLHGMGELILDAPIPADSGGAR